MIYNITILLIIAIILLIIKLVDMYLIKEHYENSKFEKYSCCFNKILVEADTIEANNLKSKGNIIIDKAIGKKQNKLKNFYITQGEGCSSLLKPKDINIEFYTSGNTKRFKIKNITKVSVIDLHTALLPHTDVIHYLKLTLKVMNMMLLKEWENIDQLF